MKRYNTHFVIKIFIQRESIDYIETFNLVLLKYFFKIRMILVVPFDIELY